MCIIYIYTHTHIYIYIHIYIYMYIETIHSAIIAAKQESAPSYD